MRVEKIRAKTVLTRTGIEGYDYCINPYVGCAHGCSYCYARFMKRFTGHLEPWGEFVDVKVNAADVLRRQLRRARRGSILIGTVTDPYQPAEKPYRITRECLEALMGQGFSIDLLTRSDLVLRDIDLLRDMETIEVGLSVTTDDETTKTLFEPNSPSIRARVDALEALHDRGISTYAFIGPMLPLNPKKLVALIAGKVDAVLVDRLNYPNKVKSLYRRAGLTQYMNDSYFHQTAEALKEGFTREGIPVSVIF